MKRSSLYDSQAVERLRELIHSTTAFHQNIRADEPDWTQEVKPIGLSEERAEELIAALKRVWLLPFANVRPIADLLFFQYAELPRIAARLAGTQDKVGTSLCGLYELLMGMTVQGFSAFPQNPAHLAEQVWVALRHPRRNRDHLLPLLDLLINRDTARPDTGLNAIWMKDPDFILESEHNRRAGLNEGAWKTPFKYAEFEDRVMENPRFKADWKRLQRQFRISHYRDADGIIRRSRIEEGNWRRPIVSDLASVASRFQVAFDFFCWKWFLYGMKGDEPLVQKLSYTLTPFGTMIFIPAYWSFDPKRDLNWDVILRLHRARGIERQGVKLSPGRNAQDAQLKALLRAERRARQLKLRGYARYAFLKAKAGLVENTDNAQVRRMLRQSRRFET